MYVCAYMEVEELFPLVGLGIFAINDSNESKNILEVGMKL